ncbi:tetratricopeptide repeat-containing sensor histidine kinase [Ekhidna sp.]|uniref:tetratricopeptide repeat-containing sensor histidine kinase n=1 Tax=Ekhidna sp. TaxID=2608089 RepID=UPI00329A6A19
MHKITVIACLLLVFNALGQSSKIDSLELQLPGLNGEERVTLLHELVKASWTIEPNRAVKYGREAIAISKDLNDLKLQSISYRLFGGLYNYMSLIDSGRYFKSQALKLALQLDDPSLLSPTYNNLGVTSQTVGNYVEALNYYYMSYLIGKQLPDFESLSVIISNISEVYHDLSQYDSAIKYAAMAVSLTKEKPNTSRHLLAKVSLARANLSKGNLAEAEESYQTIIEIGNEIGERRYVAYANQGLGRLYDNRGNKKISKKYFHNAFDLFVELDDQAYIAEVFLDLSTLHIEVEPDSAIYYTQKSLSIAKGLNLNDIILANYKNLIALYSNEIKLSLDSLRLYYTKYNELESIQKKDNNLRSIEGMFAKIQEEQIGKQLAAQSLELQQKTFQTNFLIVLTFVIVFFAIIILRNYQKQKQLGINLSEANDQLEKQNELIDKKNKDLEALDKEKNSLINIVAHDLKNPLFNIMGSVQLIKEETIATEKELDVPLEIIEGSATRLSSMVTKILDVEAIERGLSNLELESVNLSETLSSICKEFESQALAKQIEIHSKITKRIMIQGEQTYVNQIIENLISNAIKFSPADRTVFISLGTRKGKAQLEVKDQGPGISKEEQGKLFQVFQKLSASPTGNETSSGLGLSIVKKYIDAMGGKIWCKSEKGQGASFFAQFQLE